MVAHRLQRARWLVNAAQWHLASQHRARCNALLASTALTALRQQRMDVENFLAEHAARREAAVTTEIPTHVHTRAVSRIPGRRSAESTA